MRGDRSVSRLRSSRSEFAATVLYDIPFFEGLHGFGKAALDGWQALDDHDLPERLSHADLIQHRYHRDGHHLASRPDRPTETCAADQRTWQKWFNTAALRKRHSERFGTSPRTNAIRLPGLVNMDFSISKRVTFMERRAFEFRAEFFNLLKHYNPDPQTVDTNLNSATFGSVGGGVQGIATRVTQLGAKLHF